MFRREQQSVLGIPPQLLENALSPELHRKTRAICCHVWPWEFVAFVLAVWVIAKQGSTVMTQPCVPGSNFALEGGCSALGPDAIQKPRSLLAAMLDRWAQRVRPERPPTPKELLPKDLTSLWRLGDLARQIKEAPSTSSSVTGTTTPSSSPQEQLNQLQQQAAALMRVPLPADAVTPEMLDQMLEALEVWEKKESLQARLRGFFSLGTVFYCLGIIGVLSFSLPVARLIGMKILRLAYKIIPEVLERLKLRRVLVDLGPRLVVALVRVNYALLMPLYPGLGLLPSLVLISTAMYQRPTAGVLLSLSAIALGVLNLTVALRMWLRWSTWLRWWAALQPLLEQIPPEHADLLVRAHARGRVEERSSRLFWAILVFSVDYTVDDEKPPEDASAQEWRGWRALRRRAEEERERQLSYLELSLQEMERAARPTYPGNVVKFWLRTLFVLLLSAPLARAHSSQLLGFVASGAFFFAATMGFVAVLDTLPPSLSILGLRRGVRGALQDGYILGKGPVPTFAASLLVLTIRGVTHAVGVGQELAPFGVGFNVFGSMATLTVSYFFSEKWICKGWAKTQGLSPKKVHRFFMIFYYTLLALVIVIGATLSMASFFNVGCIYLVFSLCLVVTRTCAPNSRSLAFMLISLMLCGAGWFIHAHPEFLAHALGYA